MVVAYYVWVGLVAAKVAWNFAVPYASLRQASRHPEAPSGISLMLFVEWSFAGLASATVALAAEPARFPFGVIGTFAICAAAVGSSYLHGIVVSLVVRRKRSR